MQLTLVIPIQVSGLNMQLILVIPIPVAIYQGYYFIRSVVKVNRNAMQHHPQPYASVLSLAQSIPPRLQFYKGF